MPLMRRVVPLWNGDAQWWSYFLFSVHSQAGLRHVRNAKHYEVRLRFLQQLVLDKQIQFKYCPTDLQLADLLTKPLDSIKFLKFRDQFLTR